MQQSEVWSQVLCKGLRGMGFVNPLAMLQIERKKGYSDFKSDHNLVHAWPNKQLSWLVTWEIGWKELLKWHCGQGRSKWNHILGLFSDGLSFLYPREEYRDRLRCSLISLSSTARTLLCLQNSHDQLHSVTFIPTSSTCCEDHSDMCESLYSLCWQDFFPRFWGVLYFIFSLFTFLWICQRKSIRVDKYDYPSFKVYF